MKFKRAQIRKVMNQQNLKMIDSAIWFLEGRKIEAAKLWKNKNRKWKYKRFAEYTSH